MAEAKAGKASRTLKIKGLGKHFGLGLGSGRLVALLLLAAFIALRFVDPAPLQTLRTKTFDTYNQLKPREVTQRPVTIIDIDERSLSELGQWPWPRTLIAELVTRLTAMGAVTIGFDFVFPEPDRMSPRLVAEAVPGIDDTVRQRLASLPTNDEVFAQAIASSRVVLGQSVHPQGSGKPAIPPVSFGFAGPDPTEWLEHHAGTIRNLPVLESAAAGVGIFNPSPELDGIIRRVPMVVDVDGRFEPSITLEMLRVATGNKSVLIKSNPQDGIEGVVIRPNLVSTDGKGRVYVYFSHHDPEKYVSAVDVLNGAVDPEKIAGHLILLGTSAVGLLDIRTSPLDHLLPGVEVHAQILENILQQTQLHRPKEADGVEVVAAVSIGLLMIILVPLAGARLTVVILLGAVGIMAAGSWYYFAEDLTLYDPVYPMLVAVALYMWLTFANYSREEAQRRQVRDAFSRYMSPALVERLAQDPSQLKLGGEMRDMTLLFCDVRGFTTISEQFDAQGLTRLINKFLTPMTNVILERKGTIDKYMGDCIMAFWNAPLDDDAHAANACRSALAMVDTMEKVNVELEAEAKAEGRKHIPLRVGIGLNSGQVCVGNMGSDQRFDYSVLGDNVNLASRLEGQSKTYGVTIVIGENTKAEAEDYAVLELDLIKVKGKTKPVRIFTLLGDATLAQSAEFKALKEEHDAMLAAYRLQEWPEALKHLEACRTHALTHSIHGFYDLYEERIHTYAETSPGADWDGVFTALSK